MKVHNFNWMQSIKTQLAQLMAARIAKKLESTYSKPMHTIFTEHIESKA
jgi:hypothetical protein